MRLTLESIQFKLENFQCNKLLLKNKLFSLCHKNIADEIISKIRGINGKLFDFLSHGKNKKLQGLNPNKSNLPSDDSKNTPNLAPAPVATEFDNTVRCVPDTVELSQAEISLLSKGLNFVPTTPQPDLFRNQVDIQQFFRRLLLKAHFHEQNQNKSVNVIEDSNSAIFSKISTFTPKTSWFPTLDKYIKTCLQQIQNLKTKPMKKHNLSAEEQTALRHLKSRQDIVIKPADKGGAVVAWDSQSYVSEGHFQLGDSKFYKSLKSNNTKKNHKNIKDIITLYIDNEDLPEEAQSLVVRQTSHFQILHASQDSQIWKSWQTYSLCM